MSGRLDISIVVPVYNEEDNLPILHGEIRAALASMGLTGDPALGASAPSRAEVIYVDDCSTDASLLRLLELRKSDRSLRIVKFRRNFGQTAAMAAGFDVARGRLIVTLDGDLQNDPADIPRMVERLQEGYDVVAGWRRIRHDGLFLRRIPSIVANRMISLFTGVSIHDTGCTLKVFRSELIKTMSIYAEQHRFLPVLSAGTGARVTEMVVNHRPRLHGTSKYGIGRATRVLLDLLTVKLISQFSHRPLQYFGLVSVGALIFGMLFATASLVGLTGAGMEEVGIAPPERAAWHLNEWEMAILTVEFLILSLFVYFALLGLLGELAVKASGMHRRSTLDRILNELH